MKKIKRLFFLFSFFYFISNVFYINPVWAVKWKELKSQHFVVYYKEAPRDYAENVSTMAEDYYQEISNNLGIVRYKSWTWDDRAEIYIYDNSDDYVTSAKVAGWSHGVASPKDKVIRTFPAAHGFFDSTLPHELAHIIFREFIGFKAKVPLWFEEGVAMYQEQGRRWGAHQKVRKFIEADTFVALEDLSLMRLSNRADRDKIDLFYTEAASITQYLIGELGRERFVRFCRKLKDGNPFEWTMKSVYVRFRKMDDLNKAWVAYLKK